MHAGVNTRKQEWDLPATDTALILAKGTVSIELTNKMEMPPYNVQCTRTQGTCRMHNIGAATT